MFAFCKNNFLLPRGCLVLALLCFVHTAESFQGGEPLNLRWYSSVNGTNCPYSYSSPGPAVACGCPLYTSGGSAAWATCAPNGQIVRYGDTLYGGARLTRPNPGSSDTTNDLSLAIATITPIVQPPLEPESDPEPEPEVTPEPEPGTDPEPQTGPGPKPSCPKDETNNPVKIARGEKYYSFTDIRVSGSFPLQFGRTYRSEVVGKISNSELKTNGVWYWSQLSKRVYAFGTGASTTVYIMRGNQRGGLHFAASGSNWIQTDAGVGIVKSTLTGNITAGWILTLPDGTVEQYNTAGYITLEQTPQGLSHSITYIDAVAPSTIQTMVIHDNQTGDDLVITLDGGGNPLSASKAGMTVQYLWDANARLQAVVYPDDDSDATNNPVQVFEYDAAADASAILTWDALTQTNKVMTWKVTGIFELSKAEFDASLASTPHVFPESKRYSKVTYDTLGRVLTSALWKNGTDATEELTFAYSWDWNTSTTAPTTTVTNTSGLATVYSYQTSTALNSTNSPASWKLISVIGNTPSACRSTSETTVYSIASDVGGAGFVKTTSDSSGTVFTKRTRNTEGRITVLQAGLGAGDLIKPESQKVETDWHADITKNLPIAVRYFGSAGTSWKSSPYRTVVYTYDDGINVCSNASTPSNRPCSITITDETSTSSPKPARTWTYNHSYYSSSAVLQTQTVTDPLYNNTVYSYNNKGQLISTTNALGHEVEYAGHANNVFGLPETITDVDNGVVTRVTYNAVGRVDTITSDDGNIAAVTDFNYDGRGLLSKMTQADGSYLEYFYNSAHHLTGIKNNLGEYIEYTPSLLDGNWKEQEICTAGGNPGGCTTTPLLRFERVFDALGRLSAVKDAAGTIKQTFGYDENNNLITHMLHGDASNALAYDYKNIAKVYAYDASNRLIGTRGFDDCDIGCVLMLYDNNVIYTSVADTTEETHYEYNAQDKLKKVTAANGVITSYSYSGFGDLIQESSTDRGPSYYSYDNAGNLVRKMDGRNKKTCYKYDALNRLTQIDYGFTGSTTTTCASDAVFVADISYTYDQNDSAHGKGVGRLTHVVDSSGVTDYKYNALGLVTEKRFDPEGAVGTLTTGYDYNNTGAVTKVTYPGGRVVDYSRPNGRLAYMTLHYASTSLAINGINYQPFGGIKQYTRPFGSAVDADTMTTVRGFDTNGLLQTINTGLSTGSSINLGYAYDAFNNIKQITDSLNPDVNQSFVYDTMQRLHIATGVYGRYTYHYDAVGNRQSVLLERSTPTAPDTFNEIFTDTYSYDAGSNRLNGILRQDSNDATLRSRTFSQDGAGNTTSDSRTQNGSTITRTLIYGNDNRLHSVTAP